MHPFWDAVVKIYPKWLAPNLITFTGFMCLVVQWISFSIYDFHFYGYCFDREDCSPRMQANLTARQAHFHEHIEQYGFRVPPSVCSCIPASLWLLLTITQFLSHHLGILFTYSRTAKIKNSNLILIRWHRWEASASYWLVIATRWAIRSWPRLMGYSISSRCSLLHLWPLASIRHWYYSNVRLLVDHLGLFYFITLGKVQHGCFVLALVLWSQPIGTLIHKHLIFRSEHAMVIWHCLMLNLMTNWTPVEHGQ